MLDLDIPESPLRPVLDGGIHIDPTDRSEANEAERQAAFVATMRRIARGCLVAAVPNGGRRTTWEAGRAKTDGLYTGFPDVMVLWADRMALIEFKDGKRGPSPQQIETLNWLHLRGHAVAVCRSATGAMDWLREQGAPLPQLR